MPETPRPDPDSLLAVVQATEARATRGRLKVFFGMSAGVGKTYAMLEEARKRAAEGTDVVIGYAEPHIRPDTEALLLGLDLLPYKLVPYRNAILKEFDLDAALARHPALICVDELAHTNAPGLRHNKRWQDIEELLAAGISVYSTLNVQHLESANDIVEHVTSVKVRETIPDSILEKADEVELVDIAPEELLERFAEGRVYRPDQAGRAAKNFFNAGNLLALRELALRTVAQRVDQQMLAYRSASGASAPWAATERVLVCVGPSPMSARLVRSAKRLATSLRADFVAASVESPAAATPEPFRRATEAHLRLAESLGGRAAILSGHNVADELVAYARDHNVTKIVVGKPLRSRWHDFIHGSIVDELIRKSGPIDIYVIRGGEENASAASKTPRAALKRDWTGYAVALAVAAGGTALGWPLYHRLGIANENVLMLYLLGVVWVATHHSRASAALCSILSVLAFDFIFVPPEYSFAVSDRQYIVTFAVMLLTALVISALTHRSRAQADAARERERRTAAQSALARELAGARTVEQITAATLKHTAGAMGIPATLLRPGPNNRLEVHGESALEEKELGVAQWAFDHAQLAGRYTATLPAAAGMYAPLLASRGAVGVLGLYLPTDPSTESRHLFQALAAQAASALERAGLAEETRVAWERVESEFIRNTLLSGVSHELRTPLAAITGAASTLQQHIQLPQATRDELLQTVATESQRMNRLITNLLDMTRLDSGGLVLTREWMPLADVIGSVLNELDARLDARLGTRPVNVHIPADLPLVYIDPAALSRVLANLLDNAVEYTPPNSPITISARLSSNQVVTVEVADHGPGVPPGTEQRIFEKFFRAQPPGSHRGIGLGLAIARSVIQAHGGTIRATNAPPTNAALGGAVFTFTLPSPSAPPAAPIG